jgi:hypothetical protein
MRIKLAIFFLLNLFVGLASAQSYFNKLYDYDQTNTHNNAASSSYEYSNGDFLISATKFYSSSFGALQFIKINSFGDTIFHKQYFKLNCAYYTAISGSLIKCFDDNLVQAGVYYDSTLTNADAFVVKLTEDGDTLWARTFGGIGFDNANIVCQALDSGFVLMGVTQSFSMGPASDFYLIKIDKNGNFQWQQNYGTTATEDCVSGQITHDGGFILSGRNSNMFHIIKTSSTGVFQWQQTYSGTKGICFVKQLVDSSYVLTGCKSVAGLGDQACIMKVNKNGGIVWQKDYGGIVNDWLYSVPIILSDGSIVASGHSMLGGVPIGLLIKTDSLGNQQWLRTYYANPSAPNYIYDVKLTSDNGFIMTGSGNIVGQDAWVVKVDSNGCEIANCNVGINEIQLLDSKLFVYPNPASSEINISIDGENLDDYKVVIYNTLGEEQKFTNTNSTISISHLATGVYFISAKSIDGQKHLSSKFIKQ